MQHNHHHNTTTTTATTTLPPPKLCGNCGGDAQSILHHVRHRGVFRRLCTTCVLRLHPHSFCPTCFAVYQSPQPSGLVACVKCYSSTHSSCVGGNLQSRYVCPLCANPNVGLFTLKKANEGNFGGVGVGKGGRIVDKRGAKVLVAAAMISSLSMSEAEVAARAVADRRAKEAASTRKRATQALDYMAALAAREKMKNEALAGLGRGSSVSRYGGNVGSGAIERRDGYGYNGVANGGSDVFGGARVEEKKPVVGIMVDGSSNGAVTQSSNGVDFKENGGLGGVRPEGSGILEHSSSNGVATGIDELRGISLESGLEFRDLGVQDIDAGGNPALHPPKVEYMEGVEVSNPGMEYMEGVEVSNPGMQGVP